MPERIAVVGPRRGAEQGVVQDFVRALHQQSPSAILVSGGADGVDSWAEAAWLALGGAVESYRVRKHGEDDFRIERWELGGDSPRVVPLLNEPSWYDWKSALLYRSMVVAEVADRVCAFEGRDRMRGTEFTVWVSREAEQKPTYLWRDGEWLIHNSK